MKIVLRKLTDLVTGVVYTPPLPLDVTEFYTVDHTRGVVNQRTLQLAEVASKWQGLPDDLLERSPIEVSMEITLEYKSKGERVSKAPVRDFMVLPGMSPRMMRGRK